MDQSDVLLVLAQIGVTMAGFASLATVVGQGYSKTDPEVNSIRLRGLLHIAIAVMSRGHVLPGRRAAQRVSSRWVLRGC